MSVKDTIQKQLKELEAEHDITTAKAKEYLELAYELAICGRIHADPCDGSIDFMLLEAREDEVGELARLRREVLETPDGTFEPAAMKVSRILAGVS